MANALYMQGNKLALVGHLPANIAVLLHALNVKVLPSRALLPQDPRLFEILQDELAALTVGEAVAEWYARITAIERERVALKKLEDYHIPGQEKLWPFQRVGVNFLLQTRRCLLCDEPGLGKTAQAVVAVEQTDQKKRVLVLCPNSLKGWWEAEIPRWAKRDVPITVIQAKERGSLWREFLSKSGYCIVNWELVRRMPELQQGGWNWILADEAHRAKNRKTALWRAFSKIRTSRLVLITGTPFSNTPDELWALLHLLYPKQWPSFWRFYEMYTSYTYSWNDRYKIPLGVKNEKYLVRDLAPLMIQRTKKACLPQLPAKLYTTIPVVLTKPQAAMYRDMAKYYIAELEDGEELIALNAISRLLRLRQIVSTTATIDQVDSSGKLDAIVELIKNAPKGTPFVVFSEFRATVAALEKRLRLEKIPCAKLWGGMARGAITDTVNAFQSAEDVDVLLATASTGGVGLTLTRAQTLIFVEKHYSPARQTQAEDRIHRIGQDQQCHIISIQCPGTVDDLVEKILTRKAKMSAAVLQQELLQNLKGYLSE